MYTFVDFEKINKLKINCKCQIMLMGYQLINEVGHIAKEECVYETMTSCYHASSLSLN